METIDACEGLRDRKKRETRRQLRRTALELVAANGFGAVTVEDIASAAGVSARTFFNYFATKEAALFEVEPRFLEHIDAQVATRYAETQNPFETLAGLMVELAHFFEENPENLRLRNRILKVEPGLLPHYIGANAETGAHISATLRAEMGNQPGVEDTDFLVMVTWGALRASTAAWGRGRSEQLTAITEDYLQRLRVGLNPP